MAAGDVPATRRPTGFDQWLGVAVEVEHLALELEDPAGRVSTLRSVGVEDLGLDLVDVVVETGDHGLVVVDHPVEHAVQHRDRAESEVLGVLLQLLAHIRQRRAFAVPDRDDVVGAHEELDLGELDGLGGIDVASGLEHHEQVSA